MVDIIDIYHLEMPTAMLVRLILGLSAGNGLTAHYPTALSQGATNVIGL
jgi:hypothetical protein